MNTNNAPDAKQFIEKAKLEGWHSAGRYYWDLSRIQVHYESISGLEIVASDKPYELMMRVYSEGKKIRFPKTAAIGAVVGTIMPSTTGRSFI